MLTVSNKNCPSKTLLEYMTNCRTSCFVDHSPLCAFSSVVSVVSTCPMKACCPRLQLLQPALHPTGVHDLSDAEPREPHHRQQCSIAKHRHCPPQPDSQHAYSWHSCSVLHIHCCYKIVINSQDFYLRKNIIKNGKTRPKYLLQWHTQWLK